MKRAFALLFITSLLSSFSLQAQTIHSLWMKPSAVVDGDPSEWPQPFRYYDGATKLQFAIGNDTGNIYVCIKITDDITQMRLFRGSLNVWIDPKGKKKETVCISFPTKQETNPEEGPGKHHEHNNMSDDPSVSRSNVLRLKQHAFLQQISLRIKGFTGVPDQVLALKNNYGINVGFNWDSLNILSIEYKFPISLVMGHSLSASDTLKPISIGFVEPAENIKTTSAEGESAIDMSQSQPGNQAGRYNNMNGGMGGMGGGMNGRNGMGGGGNRGGNMSSVNNNPAAQEQKVWSKVVLNWQ